jgi:hypothetical protein
MAWKGGTNKVKMRKARWASPMVKLVEAALCLVNSAVFCSVIFFRLKGHYVRDITLFNQNISSAYHIVAIRVIRTSWAHV